MQSVLDSQLSDVQVLVSDNSTDLDQASALAGYCSGKDLEYVRPPEPLPMASHWEWALGHALQDRAVSHVAFLTDRMIMQPGALAALSNGVRNCPAKVVSYAHDRLNDYRRPVELEQAAWSGRAVEIPSPVFVRQISRSIQTTNMAMPRLLNCVVPRAIVETIRERFGAACDDAISPDYAFAFRCLAVVDTIVFYDRPVVLHYALDRSNGASVARGLMSPDHADFVGSLRGRDVLPAAPEPGILTVFNSIINEYCAVQRLSGWPVVDLAPYLDTLRQEAAQMEAGPRKRELLERLSRSRASERPRRSLSARLRQAARIVRSPTRIGQRLWSVAARWTFVPRMAERLTGHGTSHPDVRISQCVSRDEGLALARACPRKPHRTISWLEVGLGSDGKSNAIRHIWTIRE